MSDEQHSLRTKRTPPPVGSIRPAQYTHFGSENGQDEDDTLVSQGASKPVEQSTGIPVIQPTSIPVGQQDSIPALMKGTYYITPEHDLKLERIRLARRARGHRIDKSALIREAIDLLTE